MKPLHWSMPVFLVALNIVVLLSGCQYSTDEKEHFPVSPESNLPIISADYNHDFVGDHIETPPVILQYEVTAGDGFILDVANHDIQIPRRWEKFNVTNPNFIEVNVRKYDHTGIATYYVDWKNDETSYIFTSQTLGALDQEKSMPGYLRRVTGLQFTGLQSGQEVVVAIVFIDGNGIIYPLWGALINVK